ncbi:hypothetical protein [Streptacidiphilus sp. P02-A3a]|uniref:hypothetical protein n=1 Tax=Streptacidiphilus sp. P02-A3a TaxID=2704468 RepID=UPI0015FE7B4F|nr:hypothetical protein [Streptacidiphilus sp. P02-A3a]QMU70511.1 hypothetical protein GXP74_22210 [Streptacidiphilus sp. P02-A3a]
MGGTERADGRAFVSDIARRAVAAAASEELPFFDPLAAAFSKRGELPRDHRYTDGTTESGWDEAVLLIAPVALTLANSRYNRLMDNDSDEILTSTGHGLSRVWRRLRRRTPAPDGRAAPTEPPRESAGRLHRASNYSRGQ